MADRAKLKAEIMATVVEFMLQAEAQGLHPYDAAKAAFPGMPTDLLIDAEMAVHDQRDEAWWQTVERTIDGEILHRAIAGGASE